MTDDESSLIRVQLQAASPEIGDAEGDGVSIPEGELKDLSADRPRTALPLSKQLMILLSMGYDPESAVGQASLLGDPLPDLSDVFLARDLEKEDAVRLNVSQRLTEKPDYRIADSFPSNLGVSGSASVNTVGSIDDRLEGTPAADHIDIELRSVARAFEETPLDDELLTLPEETTDGTGPPPDTQLTRQITIPTTTAMAPRASRFTDSNPPLPRTNTPPKRPTKNATIPSAKLIAKRRRYATRIWT